MSQNNDHKSSPMERLSSVAAEMARPRVVESAKEAQSVSAGGEDGTATPSARKIPAPRDRAAQPLQDSEFILISGIN